MTVIEQALAPIFTGHNPDDLDTFADKVTDHVTSALKAAMLKVMSIPRFKIKVFGPRDSKQDSWEGGYSNNMSYWASVEYPTSVLLNQKVKVDLARRWEEAVAGSRNKFTAPPLTPQVLDYFAEWLQDNFWAPEGLSRDEEEDLLDRLLSHPSQGIETQAQMSETNYEGESEDHVESPDVDVRFRFTVDDRNAKISVRKAPDNGSVILDITLPVKVQVSKIVGPWDNDYMNRRASVRVAHRYLSA